MRPRELAVLLAVGLVSSAVSGQAPAGDLGRIEFSTSGGPEAQARFLRGALLLHSFEYEDAAEEFRQAQNLEPGFAMAYWGEAMTFNHPLWMERDRDAARKVLELLASTPEARQAKAPTRREKMYLGAVEVLYADGEKAERDRAYAEAMRRLHEEFPDDLDAASLYALALLGSCEGKRDFATYMQAAAVVEEVFARNPQHPGAAHYLIHSYDDPVHAPLGMRPARAYATIAPSAAHALHMPSHIFLAEGLWNDVVASNEASWKASVERAERKNLGADAHGFHALYWLEYAYLQQGRYGSARQMLALMEADVSKSGSKRARTHLVSMRAAYLVGTGQWSGDVAGMRIETKDLSSRALDTFVDGLAALESGDPAGAEKAFSRMSPKRKEDNAASGHTHGGPSSSYGPTSASTDAVLRKELEAKILFANGQTGRALDLLKEAAGEEDAMSFDFGPPDIVIPTHEMLGEMLVQLKRFAEARREFQASLARAPRRSQSLLGLARAAAKEGDAAAARKAYGELKDVWSRADSGVAGLQETRQSAAPGS
jgi:tetratricopeptide (TPR) repeat protein